MEYVRKRMIYAAPFGRFFETHNGSISYLYALDSLLRRAALGSPIPPDKGLLGHASCLAWEAVAHHEPGWFKRISYELLIVRDVEAFIVYVREMVSALVGNRPDLFASPEGRAFARRLPRIGYKRQLESLTKALAVDFAVPPEESRGLDELVVERHVIVHRHGRVDEPFLKKSGRTDLRAGDQLPISNQDLERSMMIVHNMAGRIDDALVQMFGLEAFAPRG